MHMPSFVEFLICAIAVYTSCDNNFKREEHPDRHHMSHGCPPFASLSYLCCNHLLSCFVSKEHREMSYTVIGLEMKLGKAVLLRASGGTLQNNLSFSLEATCLFT